MSDGWKLVLRTDEDGASVVWLDDIDDHQRIGANAIIIGKGGTPLRAYRDALGVLARLTSTLCARIHDARTGRRARTRTTSGGRDDGR